MDEVVMNGDLISRKALLGKLFPYGMPDGGNYGINARAVRDAVVGAKAVEAEPVVHAYWDSLNRCSNCCVPAISHDIDEEVEAFYLTKRCPYCGAHMDEEVAADV